MPGCQKLQMTLTLMCERQSARMSKITNDGLTRSGTGCFTAVPMWQQWAPKVNHFERIERRQIVTAGALIKNYKHQSHSVRPISAVLSK